ncbi:MAG: hypothetical protein ACYDBJ_29050 [Aggregatilineales bacterium]
MSETFSAQANQAVVSAARSGRRERVIAYVTPQMKARLDQVLSTRARGISMSDLACEALELFLTGQEDQIGSRQHFSRSLQRRIDQLEARLANYLNLVVFMQANGFALLVQHLTGDSNRVQPGYFLKIGVEAMARDGEKLRNQLRLIERDLETGDEE